MSTKKREVIFAPRIMGAKIRAERAQEAAKKAQRAADRAEAALWETGTTPPPGHWQIHLRYNLTLADCWR